MSELVTILVAYVGVYAGVFLGSLSAEELPVGRYRLRIVQMLLAIIVAFIFAINTLFQNQLDPLAIIALGGLLFSEFAFILDMNIANFKLQPRNKILLMYGFFGAVAALTGPNAILLTAAIILLYGLVSGSLIAEPYVHDRSIVPWKKPYAMAFKWTWTYPIVAIIVWFL